MATSSEHPAIGIDLGTTFSAVAVLDEFGRPETIRNSEGGLTTPSAVFFDRTHPIVGVEAMEAGLHEPDRLALFSKRDVGEQAYRTEIRGERFPPEVLQALILQKIKNDVELKLGPIHEAVITVPAFFNEPCRKATQDAGKISGLEVLDIINEPTAAAITYGIQHGFLSSKGQSRKCERLLVYDLGGGTFDVSVMEIDGSRYTNVATAGDVYLGGIDWDQRLVDYVADAFIDHHGFDPREDDFACVELRRKANQTKHALTQRESVTLTFAHEGKRLRMDITQAEFARITEDLVERTLMTTRMVMKDAALDFADLTRLILVGGSTRMPMIQKELQDLTQFEVDRSLSPDEAVCHGAAIYSGIVKGQKGKSFSGISIRNVNSHDLGVLALDPKTGQPRRKVMIQRNTQLPARCAVRFRTHQENQENVRIHVIEGGDEYGNNATTIGNCVVHPLPPNTRKGSEVDVQFDYQKDGRLKIHASLPALDREAETLINRSTGLEDGEILRWRQRIQEGLCDPESPPDIDSSSVVSQSVRLNTVPSPLRSGEDQIVNHGESASREQESKTEVDPALQAFFDKELTAQDQPRETRIKGSSGEPKRVSPPQLTDEPSPPSQKPVRKLKRVRRMTNPPETPAANESDWKSRRKRLS